MNILVIDSRMMGLVIIFVLIKYSNFEKITVIDNKPNLDLIRYFFKELENRGIIIKKVQRKYDKRKKF